ncbi:MAG: HAMP domain-containing histidine kinase [Lachnospiraceae bacterium]|nr:HAMP domain-containing histidine kinase [Lachnospiraceae bacterium]
MRLGEYLSAKAITLCFLGIGGILLCAMAAVAGLEGDGVFLLAAGYLLLVSAWLLASFWIERGRIRRVEQLAEMMPEKYLLGEVLPVPCDPVERRYFRVMKEISRSAVDRVEQSRREKEEYCDYVESWIHELKTPLTACALILSNSNDMKYASPAAIDARLRKLRAELKRADNLTETILYYARLRTAQKDTMIRQFQAAEVIGEAVKSQMELLMAAGIQVEAEGDFTAHSDSKALCFLLKQLLINCAKYCPGCLVRICAEEGKITVEDNGIGIPSQELSRVTERGFTGTNGRRLGSSTGMGLYLVRELCQWLDIALELSSVEGEYTRVTLSFGNLTKM